MRIKVCFDEPLSPSTAWHVGIADWYFGDTASIGQGTVKERYLEEMLLN